MRRSIAVRDQLIAARRDRGNLVNALRGGGIANLERKPE
jgi:hypothetical protein